MGCEKYKQIGLKLSKENLLIMKSGGNIIKMDLKKIKVLINNHASKRFNNAKLGIELTSYVDNKQNIWFLGKDIANILGYSDTDKAIRKHVDEQDK